jgi:RNA polymerase sigma factor (sigma-70 family)
MTVMNDPIVQAYKRSLASCPQHSEAEYAQAKADGNIDLLVTAALPAVFKVAGRLYATANNGGAAVMMDMVQEGNLALYKAAEAWDPDGGTYWVVYASHYARGTMKDSRLRGDSDSCGDLQLDDPRKVAALPGASAESRDYNDFIGNPDPMNNPENVAERDDIVSRIDDRIATLSETQQRVLRRLYKQGMTQAEIARQMDISEAAVSRVHSRGLRNLKNFPII